MIHEAGHTLFFHRGGDESPEAFGDRMRDLAAGVTKDSGAGTVVLLVDDGEAGAPDGATFVPCTYDAGLVVTGLGATDLPAADGVYAVRRRVIKARRRGRDGDRSAGFTIICPSVRAPFLTHDRFNDHWRENHSKIHVASSPGTCHYEQHIVDEKLTPDAPDWDGIGYLSFASYDDHAERLFGGPAEEKAIIDDVARFLDLAAGQTLPASEFVYRDGQAV